MQTTKKYFTHYILERARLEDETQDETQDETRDPKSAGSVYYQMMVVGSILRKASKV